MFNVQVAVAQNAASESQPVTSGDEPMGWVFTWLFFVLPQH
jgi:hypothetical protein